MPAAITRVIGVGNPLMGDDGLGIWAIDMLGRQPLPEHVELIDGGCGGLKLLPLLCGCRKLIIIDAADFKATPGSIKVLEHPDIEQLASTMPTATAHHFALPEILRLADKGQQLPPLTLLLVQVASCRPEYQLSSEVEAALPQLLDLIFSHI